MKGKKRKYPLAWVYVLDTGLDLGTGRLYKIGCSGHVGKRIWTFKGINPLVRKEMAFYLGAPRAKQAEQFLHQHFEGCHFDRELFSLSVEDLDYCRQYLRDRALPYQPHPAPTYDVLEGVPL